MPHSRNRHIMDLFQKKVAFSRIVAIQGCRQSGKSFFAREFIPTVIPKAHYITLDQKVVKTFAEDNPESFLKKHQDASPLIIDEAQKVPDLFDALKFEVDQDPMPGQYVILGSTEFSKLMKIRESLTGRMSRLRLFPLTLSECLELPLSKAPLSHLLSSKSRASRGDFLKHLDRGGFPGIFSVRDEASRNDFFKDWLDLTLERDLHQFPGIPVDSELASEILQRIATISEPNASSLAKAVKKDTRKVQRILQLLETLFVIHRVSPIKSGTGKPLYFLCDVGLAAYLGADFERQLWTCLLQEQLSQRGCRPDEGWKVLYYRSPKGKFLHLILENIRKKQLTAIKILSSEHFDSRDFEILKSFSEKVRSEYTLLKLIACGPMVHGKLETVDLYPWEAIV